MKLALVAAASISMSLPLARAATPAARWGQQAVYVESKSAVYIVGGETSSADTQITNDVLILPVSLRLCFRRSFNEPSTEIRETNHD